ncbi:DUF1620-domain-containing protein [Hysterangium stoloniferum]|nr:DUF1620-domain-containing protein [Hysterangium stoloniferum]
MLQVWAWLFVAVLPCLALYQTDAGKIDWHKELVGIPRTETPSVAPRIQLAAGADRRSFIISVSKSNVLSATTAVNGSIAWRYVLDPVDVIGVYQTNPGYVVTLSGPGGAYLRSYDITSGDLIFESRMHRPITGRLLEPARIGQDIVFSVDSTSDIFVLTNAFTVRRIDGLNGETKWQWSSEEQSSSILFSKLISTVTATYVVGLTKSFRSYTLHVVVLDSSTGALISSTDLSSSINGPADFVTLTSAKTPNPILAWLDEGYIKAVVLDKDLKSKIRSNRDNIYEEIKDLGVNDAGILLALKQDGTSHVLRIDQEAQGVGKIWEFSNSALATDQSQSIYAGGYDRVGLPYVARVHWSHTMHAASLQLFAANGADGQGMVTGFTFPFKAETHGTMEHVAIEAANPQPYTYVSRAVFTTSTGAVQLWQQENMQWTREESLTEITSVEFIDLPEPKAGQEGFSPQDLISRLTRQIYEAQNFPSYAANFGRRFLMGASTSTVTAHTKVSGPLYRDPFGFRKLLAVATSTGKIFGIDSANGNIVWSKFLPEGTYGGTVTPIKMFTTATVSDGKQPEIVLIAHRQAPSNSKSTTVYHFEALTGQPLLDPAPRELFRGGIADAYLKHNENKTIVIVGEDHKIHLYPNDPYVQAVFGSLAPSLYFALETSHQQLSGYQISPVTTDNTFKAFKAWTASLDPSERIQTIIRRPHEPVAAIGKILGDRRTLYKYLNSHLVVVLTASINLSQCSIYLVDGAKGTVLYNAAVPAASGACNVHATLTENWLVYHYFDEKSDAAKGYRLVSVELYEGTGVDNKTRSTDLTSYSYDSSLVTVFQRSFIYPHAITAIATTSTKFGISTRDVFLLVANEKQQIQSIPRRLLDPRRPKGKPTVGEQEEWLIQYDPVLPDDPHRVISHNYKVAGVRKIVASPASLESTSIVLTYGIDLFLTRVAPSNTFDILSENFNKLQLVLTIVALALGIFITKPMVQRKIMRQRWYNS